MIPVADFGDWYEDALDDAIAQDRLDASTDALPLDQIPNLLKAARRKKKG